MVYIPYIILFAAGFALDQLTKVWALKTLADGTVIPVVNEVLEFVYLENRGAAFGILPNKQIFFYIITVVIGAAIIWFMIKSPKTKFYTPLRVMLVLILAGAAGNFYDRLFRHFVVDFIYFKPIDWPVFNVADCYVTVCAILLMISILTIYKDEKFDFLKREKKDDKNI